MDDLELAKFFEHKTFDYAFHDTVKYGKQQPDIISAIEHADKFKISLFDLSSINEMEEISKKLPDKVDLRIWNNHVYNYDDENICIAATVAAAINIRTNYINAQRYTVVKWFRGNPFSPVIPNINYIHWNANAKNKDPKVTPSIYTYLEAIVSHRIVDISKSPDDITKIGKLPELNSSYYARKYTPPFRWFRIKQTLTDLKYTLNEGYPILCGIVAYDELLDLTAYQFGIVRTPKDMGTPSKGCHCILLIGYSDDKQTFTFLNSWGTKYGDGGFGYINFNFILSPYVTGDLACVTYEGY
jgi:hypothetical protein